MDWIFQLIASVSALVSGWRDRVLARKQVRLDAIHLFMQAQDRFAIADKAIRQHAKGSSLGKRDTPQLGVVIGLLETLATCVASGHVSWDDVNDLFGKRIVVLLSDPYVREQYLRQHIDLENLLLLERLRSGIVGARTARGQSLPDRVHVPIATLHSTNSYHY